MNEWCLYDPNFDENYWSGHYFFLQTKVQELKDSRTSANQQLRMMLLDPAVNVMFQRMKKELQDYKKKLEQTQNDLTAWKFTPDR